MDLELAGRTAVVIGGSSGIGAAMAEVLAEEGCDVALTYRRSRGGAEQAAAEVRGHGRRAWVVPLELGAAGSAAGAAEALAGRVGGLDVVVLCAGPVSRPRPRGAGTGAARSRPADAGRSPPGGR